MNLIEPDVIAIDYAKLGTGFCDDDAAFSQWISTILDPSTHIHQEHWPFSAWPAEN
jgi:hypothetical protein